MPTSPFEDPFRAHAGPTTPDIFHRPRSPVPSRIRKPDADSEVEVGSGSNPEALDPDESGEPTAAPKSAENPAAKVILRNPRWETDTVGFNEETGISVEVALPESQAHMTRVEFELFAKTPNGPERISKGMANIQAGRALCKIPVYIPQYKDASGNHLDRVEYHFTAKHSQSDLLRADTAVKVVEHMAARLLESHILEDINFTTGKSRIRASQAGALKALVDRIRAWKARHPEGKLAVFGHADAVGKEEANKQLSERRARAVQAFLIKDAAAWDALAKEEKCDRAAEPDAKAFMAEHNNLSLTDKDFESIDGLPYVGCSEFNPVEEAPGDNAGNRRVAVFLLKSTKHFPIQYPCNHGDIEPCRKQKARKGQRRTRGFGCCFYDGLVQEQAGPGHSGAGKVLDVHFENEAGEKIAVTRVGKTIHLVLKTENLVGQKIDIDIGDFPFALEYQDRVLDKGILEAVEVTGELQRIEFIPRRRSGKKPEGDKNPESGVDG